MVERLREAALPALASLPPLLLPRPRTLRARGGTSPGTPVRYHTHSGLGREGYRLHLHERGIDIVANDAAGLRHAHRTLAQLRTQYAPPGTSTPAPPGPLPCLDIEDAPAFAYRGVMLDISRCRVPTQEHLLATASLLASIGFNHLQLYIEHTFAYAGHEEVWHGWDPLTPDNVRALDAHCRRLGLELVPSQNCFGHLTHWLTLPRYAHLAETHSRWTFEHAGETFERAGPFSLCPEEPDALHLIEDLLGQLLPCFTAPLVNVGCDETFDVGQGRSRPAVERHGRAAVWAQFTHKIIGIARRHGRRAMFWADVPLADPSVLKHLPGDAIALAWGYEPDVPWSAWCAALAGNGHEVWVCPGTSSWRSITGRTTERRLNIASAARDGLAAGAAGFLVTDWGDMGHHQVWPISLVALGQAADAAWTGGRPGYDARAASLHLFHDRTLAVAAWLEDLGDADAQLRQVSGRRSRSDLPPRPLRNATALFTDLHTPLDPRHADPAVLRGLMTPPSAAWGHVRDRLDALAGDPRLQQAGAWREHLTHALELARFAADRARLRRTGHPTDCRQANRIAADISGGELVSRQTLRERLDALIADHRRLWLTTSRPGGLERSCRYYQAILDDLQRSDP